MNGSGKTPLKVVGTDGNAFALLGEALHAARKAEWPSEQIEEFKRKATKGDYNQLLRALQEYFDLA